MHYIRTGKENDDCDAIITRFAESFVDLTIQQGFTYKHYY